MLHHHNASWQPCATLHLQVSTDAVNSIMGTSSVVLMGNNSALPRDRGHVVAAWVAAIPPSMACDLVILVVGSNDCHQILDEVIHDAVGDQHQSSLGIIGWTIWQ